MKEIFERFLKLRSSGVINMTDFVRGSKLIKCTEDEYLDIMWNFEKYKKEYGCK